MKDHASNAYKRAEYLIELSRRKHDAMKVASDRENLVALWSEFLVLVERSLSNLEIATQNHAKDCYQNLRSLRNNDPLLTYLKQARNADEHGVLPIATVRKATSGVEISPKFLTAAHRNYHGEGILMLRGSMISGGPGYVSVSRDLAPATRAVFRPESVELMDVVSRGVTYCLPKTHLDKPIGVSSVTTLSGLAVEFLQDSAKRIEDRLQLGSN